MNRDDIIRIYEKANGWSPKGFENTIDELERFANLVAAAEREACAKVCDDLWQEDKTAYDCREAIRARSGEKK